MNIIITGAAGFIGFHLCNKLLKEKHKVIGLDNINNYYDISLKKKRLDILKKNKKFYFQKIDISKKKILSNFEKKLNIKIDIIINLAAQAGVRYSIDNPEEYTNSNLVGFANILELSRSLKVKHLIFASTSSVYGENTKFPLTENLSTDFPISYYAATKKCNEVMAYSYSYIHKIPVTGLRFFTVYGEYGRPDMALFKFTKKIIRKEKIEVFNYGNHFRDFTYIEDVVEYITRILRKGSKKKIPYQIFNICSSDPISLKKYIATIKKYLKIEVKYSYLKKQLGDIKKTHGSNIKISKVTKYKPLFNIKIGIKKFVNWFIDNNAI